MASAKTTPSFRVDSVAAWRSPSGRSRPFEVLLAPRKGGSRWLTIEGCNLLLVPQFAGVYIFTSSTGPLYVGSSTNLRYRLATHNVRTSYSGSFITPWGGHPHITLKVKPSYRAGEWLADEYRLICKLQPIGNRRGIRRLTS